MAVRKLNPVTPGQRHKIIGAFDTITASTPEKSLLEPIRRTGGRNNQGRMTMRYIGGGHKRKYRIIDFKRDKDGVAAVVDSIQYDPNRTARIALLQYEDGEKRYIVAQELILKLEIHYPSAKCLLVLWYTTLNYTPDKGVLWLVVQVLTHN